MLIRLITELRNLCPGQDSRNLWVLLGRILVLLLLRVEDTESIRASNSNTRWCHLTLTGTQDIGRAKLSLISTAVATVAQSVKRPRSRFLKEGCNGANVSLIRSRSKGVREINPSHAICVSEGQNTCMQI